MLSERTLLPAIAKPPRPRPGRRDGQERRRCRMDRPRAGQPGRGSLREVGLRTQAGRLSADEPHRRRRVRLLTHSNAMTGPNACRTWKALAGLGLQRSWLDGELVVLDEEGRPDFQACRTPSRKVAAARTSCTSSSTCRTTKARICAMSPWSARARLEALLEGRDEDPLRFSATLAEDPTCWPAPASSVSKA